MAWLKFIQRSLPRPLNPRSHLGQGAKQPYTIAMKDGNPFGVGGRLWENWKEPSSGEWVRTFALITTAANELVAQIHDRMPLIIAPKDYVRCHAKAVALSSVAYS